MKNPITSAVDSFRLRNIRPDQTPGDDWDCRDQRKGASIKQDATDKPEFISKYGRQLLRAAELAESKDQKELGHSYRLRARFLNVIGLINQPGVPQDDVQVRMRELNAEWHLRRFQVDPAHAAL